MMARPENNLPTVAHDGAARCLLAIEMSKQSWVIAAITPLPDKISRHTLKSRSLNGLLELVGRGRWEVMSAAPPSPFASGGMSREQGISKAGNAKPRKTMIELAWLWLRYQPDSALSIWFRERVATMKGRIRRITIVAMARKLLLALWRYLETGLIPHGALLKA
jgi:hypothetical protein